MREMLISGGELMVIGMGIVFLFLAMLVFAVNSMSKIIARYIDSPTTTPAATFGSAPAQSAISPSEIAAITAAVHQYRNSRS